jgi:hypothetical protein
MQVARHIQKFIIHKIRDHKDLYPLKKNIYVCCLGLENFSTPEIIIRC